jgi:hypothetical protein
MTRILTIALLFAYVCSSFDSFPSVLWVHNCHIGAYAFPCCPLSYLALYSGMSIVPVRVLPNRICPSFRGQCPPRG